MDRIRWIQVSPEGYTPLGGYPKAPFRIYLERFLKYNKNRKNFSNNIVILKQKPLKENNNYLTTVVPLKRTARFI